MPLKSDHLYLIIILCWLGACRPLPPTAPLAAQPAPNLESYPWLYLRQEQPLAAAEAVVELIAVGDMLLGRGVHLEDGPLDVVSPWLKQADLTLGNLETVIIASGTPKPSVYRDPALQPQRLQSPVAAAQTLQQAGVDLVGLANNHSHDFGSTGLAETVMHLQQAGVDIVGAGADASTAAQPLIRHVGGLRLAFLAFNTIPDPAGPVASTMWQAAMWNPTHSLALISQARTQADAVIVSMHWGYEYQLQSDPIQQFMAQRMLEAGADLIIGHHPHVVQEAVSGADLTGNPNHANRLVLYSLGNFVFDQAGEEVEHGLALRAFFDKDGLRAAQTLAIAAGPQPRLLAPNQAKLALSRVQPPSPHITLTCDEETCWPIELPPPSRERVLKKSEMRQSWVTCGPPSPPMGGTYPLYLNTIPPRGGLGGPFSRYIPPQINFLSTLPEQAPAPNGLFWAGAIDLTGDGHPEKIRRSGEQLLIYSHGVEVWRAPPTWHMLDIALGDPNDDGRSEIMAVLWKPDSYDPQLRHNHPFIIGYRRGIYRDIWGGSAPPQPIEALELGDIDGDGREELIVLEAMTLGPKADGATPQTTQRTVAIWAWNGWGFTLVWRSQPGTYQDLVFVAATETTQAHIRLTVK